MPITTGQVQRLKFAPSLRAFFAYIGPRPDCTALFTIQLTSGDSAITTALKRSMVQTLTAAKGSGHEVTVVTPQNQSSITLVQLENTAQFATAGRWLDVEKTPGDSQTVGDSFGVFVVHAALLHTGRVLMWSGRTEFAGFLYDSWTWDPCTGQSFGPQPFNPSFGASATWAQDNDIDMFCAHQVTLPDGRLLVVGGAGGDTEGDAHGNAAVHIFDPVSEQWSELPDRMTRGRWYPTAVVLADGRVAVFSGRPGSGVVAETDVVTPPSYTPQPVSGGNRPLPIYPGLHLVKGGKSFFTGTSWRYEIPPGSTASFRMIGPTSGVWEEYPHPTNPAARLEPNIPLREEGTSVLLPPAQDGKIVLIGGGSWTGTTQDPNARPTNVEVLDTQATPPKWTTVGDMHHPRINVNAVLLPDGKVFIVGGHDRHKFNHTVSGHALNAEIFDPDVALNPNNAANPFRETAAMGRARMYHSVALLLPDGSVWCAGGDDNHAMATTPGEAHLGDQKNYQIYQPAYFFKGRRPHIDSFGGLGADGSAQYGNTFTIQTSEAGHIEKVVLIRPGATTHHTDTEQRYVPLEFTVGANALTAAVVTDQTVAPPGYYMVFIVDMAGRPCQWAQFIKLTP